MDWSQLFLSANGRIGRKSFWIGALVLVILGLLSLAVHVFAPLVWLVLLYPWICILSKRLHDFGKTGFLILIPVAVGFIAVVLGGIFAGAGAVTAILAQTQNGGGGSSWIALLGGLGIMLAFLAVAGVVKLVFLLWVGLSAGDAAANQYGPPPVEATAPAA